MNELNLTTQQASEDSVVNRSNNAKKEILPIIFVIIGILWSLSVLSILSQAGSSDSSK